MKIYFRGRSKPNEYAVYSTIDHKNHEIILLSWVKLYCYCNRYYIFYTVNNNIFMVFVVSPSVTPVFTGFVATMKIYFRGLETMKTPNRPRK